MATANDIMKGGFSAGSAKAINGQVNSAVTAAGTTQSDATALTASINVVTTAAASSGVILLACEVGDSQEVLNLGANTLTVYPDSGARINQVAADGGVLLATNTAMIFRRFSSTRWAGFLSA